MKTQSSNPQAEPAGLAPAPIVCLSGLWDKGGQWDYWQDKFPGHRVVAMELPGHGTRKGNLNWKTLKSYALDAITEIEKLGTPVILCGHSAGGLVAQLIAHLRPHLVKRIFVFASDPPKGADEKIPVQRCFLKWWVILAVLTGTRFHLRKDSAAIVRGSSSVEFGPESGLALLQILVNWYDIPRLSCPVTVFAAMNDQFLPVSLQRAIAEYHGASLIILPGDHMFHCSHLFRDGAVEAVRDVLCGFEERPAPITATMPLAARPAWAV